MNLSARNSTFALSSNGTVFAWGDNQDAANGADGASLAAVVDKCGNVDNHLLYFVIIN
jgi:alpha-tubulin suppressor-like RCC1 family protein